MDIAELKAEIERLHGASFGWALSCCRRDHAAAEDVLQSVYLKILQGKAHYRYEANFKTWLFAVIRKTALTEQRKTWLRALKSMAYAKLPPERSSLAGPAAAFERSELQKQFLFALERLPARQREALHLVFYEDLSLREAAEVMGVSIGSARQHYERGKKRLRESLARSIDREEVKDALSWKRNNPSAVS